MGVGKGGEAEPLMGGEGGEEEGFCSSFCSIM